MLLNPVLRLSTKAQNGPLRTFKPKTTTLWRAFSKQYPPKSDIPMPALSPTMEQGNIANWRKKVGDEIKVGDVLAEIETDKATMEMESQDEGFLAKIFYPTGSQAVKVGTVIAIRAEKKEDVEKFADYEVPGAAPAAKPAAAPTPKPAAAPAPAAPAPAPTPAPAPAAPAASAAPSVPTPISTAPAPGGKLFASPLARAQAASKGISLSEIQGSGPQGRVLAADVTEFQPLAKPATVSAQVAPAVGQAFTDIPNTNIRRVIASRLAMSKQTIPHYYLTINCRVDELMRIRAKLNADSKNKFKLSVNDFIVKAAALTLKQVPEANSSWQEEAVRRYHTVDINVAVNAPQGLFTPLIKDADKLGLKGINESVKELAEKAKAGKLTPIDLSIGTFTISNLGMFGIDHFAAVINPPQACILAVGATTKQVVVGEENGKDQFQVANVMSVTLSCDHRVVDGAVGAQWLSIFRDYVEHPLKLLL